MRPFEIKYCFGDHEVQITLKEGYVYFNFSEDLRGRLRSILGKVYDMRNQDGIDSVFEQWNGLQMMGAQFRSYLEKVFLNEKEVIYIPAGRSLLATLSEQLQDFSLAEMDLTMQDFITLIRRTKKQFGSKFPEVIDEYTKTVERRIDRKAVDEAYRLIREILKAEYISDTDGEKMYFDSHHWVKLMYSSSGQQEVLWILLLLFLLILQKKSAFVVIEEPEAHLFPIAQRAVVQLISLMANVTASSVLITTHSPYILTSANVLLYSNQVESEKSNQIIRKNLRISGDIFDAYKVVYKDEQGSLVESIFDPKEALIDTEYIDEVSGITNREFDQLIEVSIANDMQ